MEQILLDEMYSRTSDVIQSGLSNGLVFAQWELGTVNGSVGQVTSI